jgi:hypothetical protein
MIDYSTFKSLQILLFWGSAIGFCIWQLRSIQRLRRQRAEVEQDRSVRRPRDSGEQQSD